MPDKVNEHASMVRVPVIWAVDNSFDAVDAAFAERDRLTIHGPLGPIHVPMVKIPGPSPYPPVGVQ